MCRPRLCAAVLIAVTALSAAQADERSFVLTAPAAFEESGLARFLLPRFSLKTGTRVTLGPEGDLTITEDGDGTPAFQQGDTVFVMGPPETPAAEKFAAWLTSEIGLNTIDSFVPADGIARFTRPEQVAAEVTVVAYEGDAEHGAKVSLRACGRCHVIDDRNRRGGIGSTPSFGVLRAQDDWGSRFEAFFALAPHPAFTQVEGVTPPFDITLPPPIVPVELTLDDLDAILAFVSNLEPAELGAPIQHQ